MAEQPRSQGFVPGIAVADIVNLRTIRKRAQRKLDAERAAANRVLHGMTKAERKRLAAEKEKADRDLDQRRIEKGDGG